MNLRIGQVKSLIEHLRGPVETALVHFELGLGLRRVEVIRIRMDDFLLDRNEMIVHGKGHNGYKDRKIPLRIGEEHFDNTKEVLKEYIRYRDGIISLARIKNPDVKIPDNLFIYLKGNQLKAYADKGSGIDEILKQIKERMINDKIEIDFSNHTMRRTFGRLLWKAGVKIEEIMVILGHESPSITLLYLGLDEIDLTGKMNAFSYGNLETIEDEIRG